MADDGWADLKRIHSVSWHMELKAFMLPRRQLRTGQTHGIDDGRHSWEWWMWSWMSPSGLPHGTHGAAYRGSLFGPTQTWRTRILVTSKLTPSSWDITCMKCCYAAPRRLACQELGLMVQAWKVSESGLGYCWRTSEGNGTDSKRDEKAKGKLKRKTHDLLGGLREDEWSLSSWCG